MPGFVILIVSAILFAILSLITLKWPPKKINDIYGYRTRRAKINQELWDYAQAEGTRAMFIASILMVLVSLIFLVLPSDETKGAIAATVIVVLMSLLPLLLVERKLKRRLEKN